MPLKVTGLFTQALQLLNIHHLLDINTVIDSDKVLTDILFRRYSLITKSLLHSCLTASSLMLTETAEVCVFSPLQT